MKVTLLGTGTSVPDKSRVQSGILIESESTKILLDVGSGINHRLSELECDITKLSAVFISHFHVDHCSDFHTLIQSMWLAGYDQTLNVFAPPQYREWSRGTSEIAYPYLLPKLPVAFTKLDENVAVQHGDLTISCCPTLHGTMDTRAYKVEHGETSVVFSSDTAPCQEIVQLAEGCDLLIHECNWLDGVHPEGVHTSPSELTDVVEKVQPRKVVLNHVSPQVVREEKKVVSIVGRRTKADIIMGQDLMEIDLS